MISLCRIVLRDRGRLSPLEGPLFFTRVSGWKPCAPRGCSWGRTALGGFPEVCLLRKGLQDGDPAVKPGEARHPGERKPSVLFLQGHRGQVAWPRQQGCDRVSGPTPAASPGCYSRMLITELPACPPCSRKQGRWACGDLPVYNSQEM